MKVEATGRHRGARRRSPREFTHVETPFRPKDAATPSVACPSSWGPWRRIPPVSFAPARPRRRVLWIVALALGGVVLAVFFLAVLERFVYAGDVMPGVKVEGVDVEGKNEDAAFADISAMATKLETRAVARDHRRSAKSSPTRRCSKCTSTSSRPCRRLGMPVEARNPIEQTVGTVLRRFRPDEIPVQVSYSTAGLEGVARRLANARPRAAASKVPCSSTASMSSQWSRSAAPA